MKVACFRIVAIAITLLMFSAKSFGGDISPSDILKKVTEKYKTMEAYKAKGTITSNMDISGMKMKTETSFSILLKKPNLYLISWTQKNMPMPGMIQSGAVWSDGTQPYLYMGLMNAYSKMDSDELALSSATGISGGAAFTIPSLFLSTYKDQATLYRKVLFSRIQYLVKCSVDAKGHLRSQVEVTYDKPAYHSSDSGILEIDTCF